MGDVFGRFIAIILLVMLIFILPIGVFLVKSEKTEDMFAREVVADFLSDMVDDGRVTLEAWEMMLLKLGCNGRLYDIELSIGKRKGWFVEDKTDDYYSVSYGNEFTKMLYEDGVYYLKKGDAVTITVERKKKSGVPKWIRWLFGMFFGDGKIKLGTVIE